jgi:hypothetical protein
MKLSVGLKGHEPIMAGNLCKEIKVEDSTWTVRESCPIHDFYLFSVVLKLFH